MGRCLREEPRGVGRAAARPARGAMRSRRHARMPPDLTSLFDVLFIVVFAALIRAAAAEHAAAHPPQPPTPAAPVVPPAAAALRQRALSELSADLAGRTPLVV